MSRLCLILLSIVAFCLAAAAQQRPLLTDDIDITPPGAIEISAGVDFFQNAKFPLSGITGDLTRVGDIRLKSGFARNVEFQVEGSLQNFVAINSRGPTPISLNVTGDSTTDTDDFTVSAKIKLFNESKRLPGLGFKAGFQLPNTNQARGIGNNNINVFGKFIVQKSFGSVVNRTPRFKAYGNFGIQIMTAPVELFTQNDVWLYGLAGIYRVTSQVNIASELNGRISTTRGGAALGTESIGQYRIGAQIKASGLRFDTAASFGLTKASPRTGIIFGVTYQSPAFFPLAQ